MYTPSGNYEIHVWDKTPELGDVRNAKVKIADIKLFCNEITVRIILESLKDIYSSYMIEIKCYKMTSISEELI